MEMARSSLGVALTHDLVAKNQTNNGQLTKVCNVQNPIDENYYLTHVEVNASTIKKVIG
jgi:hypothetical protein